MSEMREVSNRVAAQVESRSKAKQKMYTRSNKFPFFSSGKNEDGKRENMYINSQKKIRYK